MDRPPLIPTQTLPPPQSRRKKVIGSVIAVAAMAGLGYLAWHLTHPDAGAGAAAGQRPGASAGPSGGGGGRG
ncbi:MAG: Efflux transporter periplasmic adaptor subunit, partial [Massilia sp.]|nr:Efflux transporter periplasmic adaptor subunit [Massilia sp.]